MKERGPERPKLDKRKLRDEKVIRLDLAEQLWEKLKAQRERWPDACSL
jgi:hypothetical protein